MNTKNETIEEVNGLTRQKPEKVLPVGTRFIIHDMRNQKMSPGMVHSPNKENPCLVNCIMDNGNFWALDRRKVLGGILVTQ